VSAPAAAPVGASTRLTLRSLSISPHGQEFLVGDPAGGDFVAVPEIAITIIHALRDGCSLGQAAEIARERAGEDVDTIDFAHTLIELGFVANVDQHALPDTRDRRLDGGRVGEWLARQAAPLFTRWAWALYGGLFLACVALISAYPRCRPRGSDLLFLHNPLESVGWMFVAGMLLGSVHEGMHWLAARVEGIPVRITISRRLYLLVLQTDLTGIWALPRLRRVGPVMAGMAFDTVLLSLLLALRLATNSDPSDSSHPLTRLIIALGAGTLIRIAFQFFIFLRTDLYAVVVTWFGCLNLTRVTHLLLKQGFRQLTSSDRQELQQSSARDLAVARWYRWLYLAGIAAAAWFFIDFFAPNLVTITRWIIENLHGRSPTRFSFWTGVLFGLLSLAPIPLTVLVLIRERARRPRPGRDCCRSR
jgi:putative peptide zinc metalloprotease protein